MSVFIQALPFLEREKIRLIAHFLAQKRLIVKEMTGLNLAGDELSDWYRAEHLYRTSNGKAKPIVYPQQVVTACRIFLKMIEKGQRNHKLGAPFQYGKTGVTLCLTEIILAHARLHNYQVELLNIPLKGEVGIENQHENRIREYSMTTNEDFFNRVKIFRCNTSRQKVLELGKKMSDTTRTDRLFIFPDESHFATAVGSLFDKLIVKNLYKHKQAGVLTVSATSFEQDYSDEAMELFGATGVELCKGYRGPSRCQGVSWPHTADYIEDDVIVDELLPANLKYYGRNGRAIELDYDAIIGIVDFIARNVGLALTTVRWHNCESAEFAMQYTANQYGLPVVPHFGKYLKTPLLEKWDSVKQGCLYIVETMTCSHTLPLEINQFVDTDTYHHIDRNTSVATVGQGGYGRMCGYGRLKSRLITAQGTKDYIEGYKNGFTVSSQNPPPLHIRVTQTKASKTPRPKLQYRIFFGKGDNATLDQVHPSTLSLGHEFLPIEAMKKLQDFCDKNCTLRRGGRYFKDASADAETLAYIQTIPQFSRAVDFEYWHPKNGIPYDKIVRHRECGKVTIIHCHKKVWAVAFAEKSNIISLKPAYATIGKSIYATGQVLPRFGA